MPSSSDNYYENNKRDFPHLDLTDDQWKAFGQLNRNKQKLLRVDWSQPGTILLGVGTKAAKDKHMLQPPPHRYAAHEDYRKNLNSIATWWELSHADKLKEIIIYARKSHHEKMKYIENVKVMSYAQDLEYCAITGTIPQPVPQHNADITSDYNSQDDNQESQDDMSIDETPSIENSDRIIRRRTRSLSQDRSSPIGASEGGGTQNNTYDDKTHEFGLLARRQTLSSKKETIFMHMGSSGVLNLQDRVISAFDKFVQRTSSANEMATLTNDLYLVNVRSVELTKSSSKGGGASNRMQPIEGNKTIVTVFCRSQSHFTRMFMTTVKSVVGCIDREGGGDFAKSFELCYVVGDDDDPNAFEKSVQDYNKSMASTRK